MSRSAVILAAAVSLALLSACDLREPEQLDVATTPLRPAGARAPDLPRDMALATGMAWLEGRILATAAPVLPVAGQPERRLMLHPGETDDAWVEIDSSGTQSLVIDAVMRDLGSSPDCAGNPEASVVEMRWSLDGTDAGSVTIDRNYDAPIVVATEGSTRLKVTARRGNAVVWCDWLLVGFRDIKETSR